MNLTEIYFGAQDLGRPLRITLKRNNVELSVATEKVAKAKAKRDARSDAELSAYTSGAASGSLVDSMSLLTPDEEDEDEEDDESLLGSSYDDDETSFGYGSSMGYAFPWSENESFQPLASLAHLRPSVHLCAC